MKQVVLAGMVALGALAFSQPAHAVVCANGVYRAGCAGPNGAAVSAEPAPRHGQMRQRGLSGRMRRPQWGAAVVRRPY